MVSRLGCIAESFISLHFTVPPVRSRREGLNESDHGHHLVSYLELGDRIFETFQDYAVWDLLTDRWRDNGRWRCCRAVPESGKSEF